jgi:hypothetical protein
LKLGKWADHFQEPLLGENRATSGSLRFVRVDGMGMTRFVSRNFGKGNCLHLFEQNGKDSGDQDLKRLKWLVVEGLRFKQEGWISGTDTQLSHSKACLSDD